MASADGDASVSRRLPRLDDAEGLGRGLLIAWVAVVLPVLYVLMAGGYFGLTVVPTTQWGGLPLSFMLSFIGLACALPLGILLALSRASDLPVIRVLATSFI